MVLVAIAAAALLLLGYTYVGYPLLIQALSRARPQRVARDESYEPAVSVLLPVYNAEAVVAQKLDSLLSLDYPADKLEILVYSDGSTDGTEALVQSYAERDARVRLVRGGERRGKPHALNVLRPLARGEVLLMTDARQPLSENALRALVPVLS